MAASDKVQDWAVQAFAGVADRSALYVRGDVLTGDQVTDDPRLAQAKLTGALVVAPPAMVEKTIEYYRSVLPQAHIAAPRGASSIVEPAPEPMIMQFRSPEARARYG